MVSAGTDFKEVFFGEPAIFIDCHSTPLYKFKLDKNIQFSDALNQDNRPN